METVLLTANGRLLRRKQACLRDVDILRISVHGPPAVHDRIVGRQGAHAQIQEALLHIERLSVSRAVTTVVTPETLPFVRDVAQWAYDNHVSRYYLFGVMPSGLGHEYTSRHGSVADHEFDAITAELQRLYDPLGMKVIAHAYRGNAECILVYGNGDLYVDPFFERPPYQLKLGNVLQDEPATILQALRARDTAWRDCIRRFDRSTVLFSP
jgi:MoaA/NifB/PqqE/SkfB family radical SAM enzyme